MKIDGQPYRSIWYDAGDDAVRIIDQRWLPHRLSVVELANRADVAVAIRDMWVRGAPLIGATAAYGMALQMREDSSDQALDETWDVLHATRPTAINLRWALDRTRRELRSLPPADREGRAFALAAGIADEDVEINRGIGRHGLELIRAIAEHKSAGECVNILTHCNAGWLATVDWGTATSPIYHAHEAGIDLHVWVDETRPRNQGGLTSWELNEHGVPNTYIVDNAGGHLMQHGEVDLVIVGTDRTTASGDVCNKIGTYLKALAAHDNRVPFYVALPSPTIDWTVNDGVREIPIEDRPHEEVSSIWGRRDGGEELGQVTVTPRGSRTANPAFDVTPSRLITGLITERGVAQASPSSLAEMFPDLKAAAAKA